MDQDAFRNLLSAPRAEGSGSSSRKVLGAPAPKRGWGLKGSEKLEKKERAKAQAQAQAESKPAFAPRQFHKRGGGAADESESAYKDRAELRRQGKDDEYKSVEKLLEDFEARKAVATQPEELAELERQRAYLGGDAEHSILVKGLDYALLAARKAELAREKGEEIDDELEMLGQGLGKKGKGDGQGAAEGDKVVKEETLGKGFKSIAQKKAEAEALAAGKKKKKKKKVKADASATAPAEIIRNKNTSNTNARDSAGIETEAVRPSTSSAPSVPATQAPLAQEEDDEDIFGDVGEYNLGGGASDPSDDEDDKMDLDESAAGPTSRGGERRAWAHDHQDTGMIGVIHVLGQEQGPEPEPVPGPGRGDSSEVTGEAGIDHPRGTTVDTGPGQEITADPPTDPDPGLGHTTAGGHRVRTDIGVTLVRDPGRDRGPDPRTAGEGTGRRLTGDTLPGLGPGRPAVEVHHRGPEVTTLRRVRVEAAAASRVRSPTRSPTPLLQDHHYMRSPSRSLSPESDAGPATRLMPLSSSAIPSLKSFLEADSEAAKAEERKLKKAKWRAAQGLSAQEGAEEMLASRGNNAGGVGDAKADRAEKQKANRDYQLLMNKLNKAGGKEASGE